MGMPVCLTPTSREIRCPNCKCVVLRRDRHDTANHVLLCRPTVIGASASYGKCPRCGRLVPLPLRKASRVFASSKRNSDSKGGKES